jgi:flagellar FliL protein
VADKPEAEAGEKKPVKSKKMMIIVGAVVLVLVLAGGGFFFMKQRAAAADEGGDEAAPKAAAHATEPGKPPVYLPMDNMVINLADPGGERVAQVGITLVVADEHAGTTVKAFLPTIRSGVLMLVSQRTAEELLKAEGKEQLAKDILREASIPFGGGDDEHEAEDPAAKKKKKKKVAVEYPVTGVLFSSFIVQ